VKTYEKIDIIEKVAKF